MFIDTHAHLFFSNFNDEVHEVINRAKNAGVDYILVPATDLETSRQVIKLVEKYEFIYGAVGIHPHDTKDWNNSLIDEIKHLAKHEKIVAIGEIGLDYFYDFSPKEKQMEAFKAQIDLALKINKPIIVHTRDSDDDMMNEIRLHKDSGLKAQFHCFNGTLQNAKELIRLNHFISFTGNITFKKFDNLRDIAANLSMESIMLETDSPFMTPEPLRGKRNEPANVKLVAEKLAEIHHLNVEDVARLTSYNVFRMFGIGSKPGGINFTYKIGDSLYINVTNRCDAKCEFCDREGDAVLNGYSLHMTKSDEPEALVYIKEIGDPKQFKEIVFCGYGEPTIRWDVVKIIAKYVIEMGGKTRLITNGHGNLINKRDIVPELKGLINTVSISFNSPDARQYSELMGLDIRYYNEMINFAKEAKNYVEKLVMTAISMDKINIEKARTIVEEKIGAEFRLRQYF
ncbi:MAG: TatD family hydrolase [Ignavibacteriaceae bacterium]|jgi:TatD DNase family protein